MVPNDHCYWVFAKSQKHRFFVVVVLSEILKVSDIESMKEGDSQGKREEGGIIKKEEQTKDNQQ